MVTVSYVLIRITLETQHKNKTCQYKKVNQEAVYEQLPSTNHFP